MLCEPLNKVKLWKKHVQWSVRGLTEIFTTGALPLKILCPPLSVKPICATVWGRCMTITAYAVMLSSKFRERINYERKSSAAVYDSHDDRCGVLKHSFQKLASNNLTLKADVLSQHLSLVRERLIFAKDFTETRNFETETETVASRSTALSIASKRPLYKKWNVAP